MQLVADAAPVLRTRGELMSVFLEPPDAAADAATWSGRGGGDDRGTTSPAPVPDRRCRSGSFWTSSRSAAHRSASRISASLEPKWRNRRDFVDPACSAIRRVVRPATPPPQTIVTAACSSDSRTSIASLPVPYTRSASKHLLTKTQLAGRRFHVYRGATAGRWGRREVDPADWPAGSDVDTGGAADRCCRGGLFLRRQFGFLMGTWPSTGRLSSPTRSRPSSARGTADP